MRELFTLELFNHTTWTPPHRSYLSSFGPPAPHQWSLEKKQGVAKIPVWWYGSVQTERICIPVWRAQLVVAMYYGLQDSFSSW